MRLVQIAVPSGKREAILDTLDEEGVDYAVTDETGGRGYAAVAHVPLPTNAVEPILSAFLGGVTLDSFSRATTERQLRAEAAAVVDETGTGMAVLEVEIERTNTVLFRRPRAVVVIVGVPPGESAGGLAARLDDRLDATAGRDLTTRVRYVTTESA